MSNLYFNYSINQDLRDKKFRTEDGYQTFFTQEIPIISDNAEFSNAFEVSKFKKFSTKSKSVGKISLYAKTITGLSDDVRISKRLHIPSSRLRGFENGKIFDAANVWGVDYDSTIDDKSAIRSSTGVALNLMTPIGPLSFSFANALTKASSDKTETFRFNLGTQF